MPHGSSTARLSPPRPRHRSMVPIMRRGCVAVNKTSVAALCAMVALAMGHTAQAATTVLDFNDLAQPGTGRKFIPQNNFKYEGFNFNSNYSSDPNFFTLGTDDPANADKDGATFGHNWSGWDLYITRADGGSFD